MPAGEPHTMLSPIEKAVLAHCEQWRTVEELQEELWTGFHFDRIPPAIAFLHRRHLIESWSPDPDCEPRDVRTRIYKQTSLGELVLLAQRRKESTADFRPERGLHLV